MTSSGCYHVEVLTGQTDELRKAAAVYGAEIKEQFPINAPQWSSSDFKALAQTYDWECERRKDGRSSETRIKQLETLERHVSICIALWMRRSRLCPKRSVEQHYLDYQVGTRYVLRSGPISIFSPKDEQDGISFHALIRALARVWRDMLPLSEVDELCRNVAEQRIMSISCAAAMTKVERRQQAFL